jgi:ribose transport system substrate-binding protein
MKATPNLRAALGVGVVGAVALVIAAVVSAGAASSASGATSKGSLLWVQPLRDHPVHRLMQTGFLQRCKAIGYSCEIVGNPSATNLDVPATVGLANAALSRKKYNGVAIYAFAPEMYPFVRQTSAKGYPTVSWHILVKKGTVPLNAITGTDPAAYSRTAAKAIGAKLGGKGKVAVTQGSFNTIENLVAKTFTQQMKKSYPAVTVLKSEVEGFEPAAAAAKASSIIQANQDLAAAFSTTGGGPATWATAQRQTKHKLVIIGMDYVRQNLDLVKSGEVYAIVAQPLYEEGAKTADLLAALAQKRKVSYYNFLPAPVVTKAKVAKYYATLKKAGQ